MITRPNENKAMTGPGYRNRLQQELNRTSDPKDALHILDRAARPVEGTVTVVDITPAGRAAIESRRGGGHVESK